MTDKICDFNSINCSYNSYSCNCIKVKKLYETRQYFQSIRQLLNLIWISSTRAPHLGHHHQCVKMYIYSIMTYME